MFPDRRPYLADLQQIEVQLQTLDHDQSPDDYIGSHRIQERFRLLAARMDIHRRIGNLPPVQEATFLHVWNSAESQARLHAAMTQVFPSSTASNIATPFIQAVERSLGTGHILMSSALELVGHVSSRDPRASHWKELSQDVDSNQVRLTPRQKAILFLIMLQSDVASQTNRVTTAVEKSSTNIGSQAGSEQLYWKHKIVGNEKDPGVSFLMGYYRRISGLANLLISEQYPGQEDLASDLWFAIAFLKTTAMKHNSLNLSEIRRPILAKLHTGDLEVALGELQSFLRNFPSSLSNRLSNRLSVDPDQILIRRYRIGELGRPDTQNKLIASARLRLVELQAQTSHGAIEAVQKELGMIFAVPMDTWGSSGGPPLLTFYKVNRILSVVEQIPKINGNRVTYESVPIPKVELIRVLSKGNGSFEETHQKFYWYPKRVMEAIQTYRRSFHRD
ncbi:hypothetical protein KBD71_04880 [Candidatus Woesebacteria bacterium]|nr:hypothetical protein [Candidatus Woesebacteria bacterium]